MLQRLAQFLLPNKAFIPIPERSTDKRAAPVFDFAEPGRLAALAFGMTSATLPSLEFFIVAPGGQLSLASF